MNHIIPQHSSKFFLLALLAVLLLSGCRDHHFDDLEVIDDSSTILIDIPMLQAPSLARSGMTRPQESRLKNLFVAIFNADGTQRLYTHFYEEEALEAAREGDTSTFKITLSGHTFEGGKYKAFAVANVITEGQDDFLQRVNLTKRDLDAMMTINDYKSKNVTLNTQSFGSAAERREVLLFSSPVTDLTLGGAGDQPTIQRIPLERIMSKITIFFSHESKGFAPKDISVYNLPTRTRLASEEADNTNDNTSYYYQVEKQRIEGTGYGTRYTIYMLESLLSPRKRIDSTSDQAYRDRAKRQKTNDPDPKHQGSVVNGEFENAPVHAPYVFIRGYYDLEVKEKSKKPVVMVADVEYTIPLGYTNKEDLNNDYNIERNTSYTYTIKVKGIQDIVIEAKKGSNDLYPDSERHPGTEGTALISEIHWELDSHFEQRLLPISKAKLKEMDFNTMRFTVTTPYGHETFGVNELMAGNEADNRYCKLTKWIQFRQNYMVNIRYSYYYEYDDNAANFPSRYPTKYYSTATGQYLELKHELLSLRRFVKLLQDQQNKARNTTEKNFSYGSTAVFGYFDPHWTKYPNMAYFTVFFDENYYHNDPLTDESTHWRKFVNTPPRKFVMTLKSDISVDRKSIFFSEPFISVSQRPIYVPYSVSAAEDGDKDPIYGFETINETGFVELPSDVKIGDYIHGGKNSFDYLSTKRYVGSDWSGLFKDRSYSDFYTMYETDPEKTKNPFLACMLRNRDSNRNGIIDEEEMVWYVPAIAQLLNFQLADLGFPKDVRLYRASDHVNATQNHWIVSSSRGNNNSAFPYFLWSNQGMSIGASADEATQVTDESSKREFYQLRCARTLYEKKPDENKEQYLANFKTAAYYRLANASKKDPNNPRYVETTFLNDRSNRLPSQFIEHGEQKLHSFFNDYYDESPYNQFGHFKVLSQVAERSLPYRAFYVAKESVKTTFRVCHEANLASSSSEFVQHPSPCAAYKETYNRKVLDGWRMPTMREMQVMAESGITIEWTKNVDYYAATLPSGTSADAGILMKTQDNGYTPFHIYNNADDKPVYVRCVKDKEY